MTHIIRLPHELLDPERTPQGRVCGGGFVDYTQLFFWMCVCVCIGDSVGVSAVPPYATVTTSGDRGGGNAGKLG